MLIAVFAISRSRPSRKNRLPTARYATPDNFHAQTGSAAARVRPTVVSEPEEIGVEQGSPGPECRALAGFRPWRAWRRLP